MSKNAKKLTRREREKLRHESEILAAAERVFVLKGFNQATIEEIAKEAEFSVGAIYTFFEGKQDLRDKVITKIIEEFLEVFRDEVLFEQDAMKAIEALIDLRVRHVQEHGAFFRLFLESQPGANINLDGALPSHCRELYDNYIQDLTTIFKKAISIGLVREMDPVYAALSLEGIVNAFTAYWNRQGISEPVEARIKYIRENFLRMILKDEKQSSVDAI